MPKAKARNAFYYFMLDFKEEQRKKGINLQNMAEVSVAADPVWRELPKSVRDKYEAKAKAEKNKNSVSSKKYTSTGIPISEIERQEREMKEMEEQERRYITNLVAMNTIRGIAPKTVFYVMDVNPYCKYGDNYLIGEMTILKFNLIDGIQSVYHEMINPGSIPIGYTSDVKLGCDEFALTMPDETETPSNFMKILANIIDYLHQNNPDSADLPAIFTLPKKVPIVKNFIYQLCVNAGENENIFRIYRLDLMFFHLINAIRMRDDEGFPKESLALVQLQRDTFMYTKDLGCEHHKEVDNTVVCSMSRAKRWCYTVMDSCCRLVGVDMLPGKHLPADFDVDEILQFNENKRGKIAASIASITNQACNMSIVSDTSSANHSTNASFSVDSQAQRPEFKRPHFVPPRKPTKVFLPEVVPGLSEDTEFPQLGRGRDRGSRGNVNK